MTARASSSSNCNMLRLLVLLICCSVTRVMCHGFGRPHGHNGAPGLIVQQVPVAECRPVRTFVTHVQTVVQEQPILKTVQQRQVQFLTQFKQKFVTVTTGTVAYVTTGVQETVINTRTRTLTERNTVTNTRYVYIPTIETATNTYTQLATNTQTQVAYETMFTPDYVTTTATTVTTLLRDSVVYEPVFETEYNFVAAPVTTTVTEQIPEYSTHMVQVQGYSPPVIVPLDQVVYETQIIHEKAPLYITTRVQAIEYQTVAAAGGAAVTIAVDCLGQRIGQVDPRVNRISVATDGLSNATGGAVARAGQPVTVDGVNLGASEEPLVSPGLLLSSNSDSIIGGTSPI